MKRDERRNRKDTIKLELYGKESPLGVALLAFVEFVEFVGHVLKPNDLKLNRPPLSKGQVAHIHISKLGGRKLLQPE